MKKTEFKSKFLPETSNGLKPNMTVKFKSSVDMNKYPDHMSDVAYVIRAIYKASEVSPRTHSVTIVKAESGEAMGYVDPTDLEESK